MFVLLLIAIFALTFFTLDFIINLSDALKYGTKYNAIWHVIMISASVMYIVIYSLLR
jgi:hypothetical protein